MRIKVICRDPYGDGIYISDKVLANPTRSCANGDMTFLGDCVLLQFPSQKHRNVFTALDILYDVSQLCYGEWVDVEFDAEL